MEGLIVMLNKDGLITMVREVLLLNPKSSVRNNELWLNVFIDYLNGDSYSEIGRTYGRDRNTTRDIILKIRDMVDENTSALIEDIHNGKSKENRSNEYSNALYLKLMGISNGIIERLCGIKSGKLGRELIKYKEYAITYMGSDKIFLYLDKELKNPHIALQLKYFRNSIETLAGYPSSVKFPLYPDKKREMLMLYNNTMGMDAYERAIETLNYLKIISNR